jgi:hypothetical protein
VLVKTLLYGILLIGMSCYKTPELIELKCGNLPKKVVVFFKEVETLTVEDNLYFDSKAHSIIENTHKEIYMPKRGVIKSKKFHWKTNVKYDAYLRYENENFILIESRLDGYHFFRSHDILWFVIRKRDGKIINSYKVSYNMDTIVFNDVFYFRDNGKIHCMKIGE